VSPKFQDPFVPDSGYAENRSREKSETEEVGYPGESKWDFSIQPENQMLSRLVEDCSLACLKSFVKLRRGQPAGRK
jgi:hypothetical protein